MRSRQGTDSQRRRARRDRRPSCTSTPACRSTTSSKADLRINGGEFEKTLQGDEDLTTGRLDSRFSGPDLDPLSKDADYDPQSAAISLRVRLGVQRLRAQAAEVRRGQDLQAEHRHRVRLGLRAPAAGRRAKVASQGTNVMPDLANAMKQNPNLKVQLNGGYFDLATPFFAAIYELQHLPIQQTLQGTSSTHFYQSGHMVYAQEAVAEGAARQRGGLHR